MNRWSMIWGGLCSTDTVQRDGFGQSMLDDIRYLARFQRVSLAPMVWRTPTWEEAKRYDGHPIIRRFGDTTLAVAQRDGRTWVARENDWYGWPDPPRYAIFAFDGDGSIWCGRDCNFWPKAWTMTTGMTTPSVKD